MLRNQYLPIPGSLYTKRMDPWATVKLCISRSCCCRLRRRWTPNQKPARLRGLERVTPTNALYLLIYVLRAVVLSPPRIVPRQSTTRAIQAQTKVAVLTQRQRMRALLKPYQINKDSGIGSKMTLTTITVVGRLGIVFRSVPDPTQVGSVRVLAPLPRMQTSSSVHI